MVMLATPVGSMTAMLAQQYDGNYDLAARGVALTAILAVVTIDGKTQVDVRGAILIDAVFSANGINADTHNVAALCRQARTVFYRRKTWLNKW